jgi:GT2 family glycosyltransferase
MKKENYVNSSGKIIDSENRSKPKVSIIVGITPRKGFDSIFYLLKTILAQKGDIDFECIIVDVVHEQRRKIYRENFPWVKLIQTDTFLYEPALQNIGVKQARGEFIVFLEDHVLLSPYYLKNLVAIISHGYSIIGGPVANGNPGVFTGWLQYFTEYHKWMPGLPDGEIGDLPGCNCAYHAEVLKTLGSFPEAEFGVATHFHKKAKDAGYKLYLCSGLEVEHINDRKIWIIWAERFKYGHLFAARRGFSLWKRILYVIFSPAIALLEYIRIFHHALRSPLYLKKFVQCTPLLLPTLLIWMTGECLGYLFGYEGRKTKN